MAVPPAGGRRRDRPRSPAAPVGAAEEQDGFPSGRPALFVGHPGHELCLHGWLNRTRPHVFVLTDGSGRTGTPRLDWTTRLLRQCGAEPCPPYGPLADADVYQALLRGHYPPFFDIVEELAAALVRHQVSYLVSDPADGYNPSHDLCRILAGAARARARQGSGVLLPGYESWLPTRPGAAQEWHGLGCIRLELSPEEVKRKVAAARAYRPLRGEMEAVLTRTGADAFRTESFRPVADLLGLRRLAGSPPSYEAHGEVRVVAGGYAEVLRYRRHVLPFLECLRDRLQKGPACAA